MDTVIEATWLAVDVVLLLFSVANLIETDRRWRRLGERDMMMRISIVIWPLATALIAYVIIRRVDNLLTMMGAL